MLRQLGQMQRKKRQERVGRFVGGMGKGEEGRGGRGRAEFLGPRRQKEKSQTKRKGIVGEKKGDSRKKRKRIFRPLQGSKKGRNRGMVERIK